MIGSFPGMLRSWVQFSAQERTKVIPGDEGCVLKGAEQGLVEEKGEGAARDPTVASCKGL